MKTRQTTGRSERGFSLLEMMVAASLLVVIMLGLLAMFYQTERAFRLGIAQSDVLTGGRSAMQLLVQDIQEMRLSGRPDTDNFAVSGGLPGAVQVLDSSNNEVRQNVFQPLYFLKRENDLWSGVRYDFNPDEVADGAATLVRLQVIPGVFPPLMTNDLSNTAFSVANVLNDPTRWPGSTNWYGRIVEGVVHLTVKAYDKFGVVIDNTTPYDTTPFSSASGPPYDYLFRDTNMPAYVELELGILEQKAFERFKAMTPANATNFLAQQSGKVHMFRQRIPIRSNPTP